MMAPCAVYGTGVEVEDLVEPRQPQNVSRSVVPLAEHCSECNQHQHYKSHNRG